MPTFLRHRPVTSAALGFALRAHGDDRREADGAPFILHPLEVASLLSSCDCSDEITAAAVLHDTLEATGATSEEIELRPPARTPAPLRAGSHPRPSTRNGALVPQPLTRSR